MPAPRLTVLTTLRVVRGRGGITDSAAPRCACRYGIMTNCPSSRSTVLYTSNMEHEYEQGVQIGGSGVGIDEGSRGFHIALCGVAGELLQAGKYVVEGADHTGSACNLGEGILRDPAKPCVQVCG